jgi:hypothetical protein
MVFNVECILIAFIPGSMPTVGDAIVAIRDLQTHLNQSLIEINSYSVKILNQDITDMDELEEVSP